MSQDIIEKLVKQLKKCDDAYYNSPEPLIPDDDYDKLKAKLTKLAPNHPYLTSVGAPISGPWPKHQHRSLIGSLEKVNNKADFLAWAENKGPFCVSPKYDGSTIVATYNKGKLTALATRGDGTIGENITQNSSRISGVPSKLPEEFSGEIRGEAILLLSDFNNHFAPEGFKNARNAANGKVREQKENELIQHVRVFWFDIIPSDRDLKTELDKWDLIQSLHLTTMDPPHQAMSAEEVWESFELWRDNHRARLDYEIDGLVVKTNDLETQESLGVVSNRPKGAMAIKFPPAQKVTRLLAVEWSRGLTGIIAPTGLLEPVDLGGVTVSRVSLCGVDEIRRLGIAIGDRVVVSRRNDVIPKVEKLASKAPDRTEIPIPTQCTTCGGDLIQNGAYLICQNIDCQGEVYGSLMTWVRELQIKGLGPNIVRELIDLGVTDAAKLYEANVEAFHKACNSVKTGTKVYEAVQSAKDVRLSTLLSGLCIPSLGETNGARLEKHFKTLDAILAASVEDLEGVPGIRTNAKKIVQGLQNKSDLINRLRQVVNIKNLDASGTLAGMSFCITGDLSKPRPIVQEWIRQMGGEPKSGISKDLTYLVTNTPESGTSKNQKADQYGVKKITEEQLYELAGSKPKLSFD